MAKYLFHASYGTESMVGLLKDGGAKRREVVQSIIEQAGGTMEAFYFSFGDADAYTIADLPGDATAVAFSLAAASTGVIRLKTTVLVTPETIDEAIALNVSFRAPGA